MNTDTLVGIHYNDQVKFCLTDHGKKIYRQRFQAEPEVDKDGFTRLLLWQYLETFGPHTSLLAEEVIKPQEIYLDK